MKEASYERKNKIAEIAGKAMSFSSKCSSFPYKNRVEDEVVSS